MSRVVVFGARGWLGGRYIAYANTRPNCVAIGLSDVNICDPVQVKRALTDTAPDLVINAAGKTHSATIPNIDACVSSLMAQSETFHSNAVGAGYVAEACKAKGIPLVHLSSGCIFNGQDRAFTEEDTPNPVSWYAQTKLMGEGMVRKAHPAALILRIRMPISGQSHPRNLITKLAGATAIVDVTNSVTVIEDLLPFTFALVEHQICGIVHAVHPQPIAFRALMRWYRQIVNPAQTCTWIDPADYRTVDGRSNCTLSTRDLPVLLPDTELAIKVALKTYAGMIPPRKYGRFWTEWLHA